MRRRSLCLPAPTTAHASAYCRTRPQVKELESGKESARKTLAEAKRAQDAACKEAARTRRDSAESKREMSEGLRVREEELARLRREAEQVPRDATNPCRTGQWERAADWNCLELFVGSIYGAAIFRSMSITSARGHIKRRTGGWVTSK